MGMPSNRHRTRVGLGLVLALALGISTLLALRWVGREPPDPLTTVLDQPSIEPIPVVVVVLDELPLASLLDADLGVDDAAFPNFAALAAGSTWFRNTTTVATFTKEAMPALLTGRRPTDMPAPHDAVYPHNLFTMLGGSHEIVSHEALRGICSPSFCNEPKPGGPSRPFMKFFGTSPRGLDVTGFLDEIEDPTTPTLFFSHIILPHEPWRYLRDGLRYQSGSHMPAEIDPPGRGRGWAEQPWLVTQAYQRHLLQLQLTDNLLGRIVRRLKSVDLYNEALVVVTADHGHGFVPGYPKRLVREANVGYLAPVPFFMKVPGQRVGRIDDAPVQTIDVVPTIADVLNARTWKDVQGRSALTIPNDDIDRGIQSVEIDASLDLLRATVRDKFRMVGNAGFLKVVPPGSPFKVGAKIDGLSLEPVSAGYDRSPYRDIDRKAEELPVLITGRIPGGARRILVVAVNGRIGAVTRTYDVSRFQALVDPRFFADGPNRIRFFGIPGD